VSIGGGRKLTTTRLLNNSGHLGLGDRHFEGGFCVKNLGERGGDYYEVVMRAGKSETVEEREL
jgi:hypothetical protein